MLKRVAAKVLFLMNFGRKIFSNYLSPVNTLFYITESMDWVIQNVGNAVLSRLPFPYKLTTTLRGIRGSIIHYGSINALLGEDKITLPHNSNKLVVTWFHVVDGDRRVLMIPEVIKHVDLWHTASILTKKKMVRLGVPKEKIVIVPLGVDLRYFRPAEADEKKQIRKLLAIPNGAIVIGSFQKDGVGWGEGLEPKIIKGPDLFCDAVIRVAQKYNVFILLTGPARGYVKARLDQANIPYIHHYLNKYEEVAEYYRALDMYLVASREEGGPLSTLEALASGIPLISTEVGLVTDVIQDGYNGLLINGLDAEQMSDKMALIIENNTFRDEIIANGLKSILQYDWAVIARQYEEKVYGKVRE